MTLHLIVTALYTEYKPRKFSYSRAVLSCDVSLLQLVCIDCRKAILTETRLY